MTPAFIILIVALPLAAGPFAHLRRAAPWQLMTAVGAGWLRAAVICLFEWRNPVVVHLMTGGMDRAYHDTYYLIGFSQNLTGIAALVLLAGTVTWLQTRAGAMSRPVLTHILFWIWTAGMIATVLIGPLMIAFVGMPRRYIEYPDIFTRITYASAITALTAIAALLALGLLLIWSIWRTWQTRQRG